MNLFDFLFCNEPEKTVFKKLACLENRPLLKSTVPYSRASQAAQSVVKNQAANAEAAGEAGSGRSPGGGNGNPLQYSCLENPMDRGAWGAIVHRVEKSWTRLGG